jgi:DNA-binding GntR family transcriptional regulator
MPATSQRRLAKLVVNEAPAPPDLSMLEPVGRETLQDQVYLQLRQALMAGSFRPGQTLTLRSVAEALGVSHMPVRGALERLEAEGALVAQFSKRTLNVPELRLAELAELRDIRVELEGLATARAAANITSDELAIVGKQVRLMQIAAESGDVEAYIRENWAFHTAVYKASHMTQLLAMVEGLWLRVGPYVRLMMSDQRTMIASMPNHHDVFKALKTRNGAAARKSIAADIRECAESLHDVLKK